MGKASFSITLHRSCVLVKDPLRTARGSCSWSSWSGWFWLSIAPQWPSEASVKRHMICFALGWDNSSECCMKVLIWLKTSSCSIFHSSELNLKPRSLEVFGLFMAIWAVFNRPWSRATVFAKSGIELLIQFAAVRNLYSSADFLGSGNSKIPLKKSESYLMPFLPILRPHQVIIRAQRSVFSGYSLIKLL